MDQRASITRITSAGGETRAPVEVLDDQFMTTIADRVLPADNTRAYSASRLTRQQVRK